MSQMSYDDLIKRTAMRAGVTQKEARALIEAMSSVVTEVLQDDGRCRVSPLGIFEVRERAGRTGRDPRTGKPIEIPASRSIGFKPSAGLKKKI